MFWEVTSTGILMNPFLKSLQNLLNLEIYQDWSGQNQPISKDNVSIMSLFPQTLLAKGFLLLEYQYSWFEECLT